MYTRSSNGHWVVSHNSLTLPATACMGALLVAATVSCTRDVVRLRELPPPVDARPFVVGTAASNVNGDGQFVLPAPKAEGLISPDRAIQLARAEVATFGGMNRGYLERERGGTIDFASLAPGRVYFADSPYDQRLPDDVHPAIRKYLGPFYLVSLVQQQTQVLSVAVSAYNSDVQIIDSHIVYDVRHGNDFLMQAVPRTMPSIPVSPEEATRLAALALSTRVTEIPELLLAREHFVPQYAKWRLTLERVVEVRGATSGRLYRTREVFVGPHGELSVAVMQQPNTVSVPDPIVARVLSVTRRASLPVDFEPIAR